MAYEFKTFYLQTTPSLFIAYLDAYLDTSRRCIALAGRAGVDGLQIMSWEEPNTVIDWSKPQSFEVWGRLIAPGLPSEKVVAFTFQVWTLSENRIKVRFKWDKAKDAEPLPDGIQPRLLDVWMRKLLRAIRRDYGDDTHIDRLDSAIRSADEPEKQPRVPDRPADLRKWRAAWVLIESEVQKGKKYEDIAAWLKKMRPELNYSGRTISDIVSAGEAGLLEG